MASEIRVDKINSLSGVGTVTLSPTGVDIAGITTAATLRATTGIVTSLTAGSLTSLGAVSGTTGTFSGAVSGTTGTFSGAVSGTTGTFSAAVSGTTGTFSAAVSGTTGTFTGDVDIADKIVHTGDTNTAIRFPAADTFTVETGGSERARIDSSGDFGIGMSPSGVRLDVYSSSAADIARFSGPNSAGLTIRNDTANELQLHTAPSDALIFGTNGENERLRIASDGRITQKTGDLIIDQSNNGYGGLRILDSTAGEYSINYIAGRNSGATAHVFSIGGRTQNSSPWANASQSECARISQRGISFNGDTAQANALDDYEEGTWTISAQSGHSFGSPAGTTKARYVKVGKVVHAWAEFGTNTSGAIAVNDLIYIGTLPYAKASAAARASVSMTVNYSTGQSSTVNQAHVSGTTELYGRISQTTGHNRSGAGYYITATYETT